MFREDDIDALTVKCLDTLIKTAPCLIKSVVKIDVWLHLDILITTLESYALTGSKRLDTFPYPLTTKTLRHKTTMMMTTLTMERTRQVELPILGRE
jgi:hypothetical protein